MSINYFTVGDRVRLNGTFRNSNLVEVDPTTVSLKVKDPSGNIDIYGYPAEVQKESTGKYYYEVDIDEAGRWHYRWEGTGTAQAALEAEFVVQDSRFS